MRACLAVQKRNDHEYAMKKTFMSGALAGPGLSRSRLHCDGRITVHTAAAPTHSPAPHYILLTHSML